MNNVHVICFVGCYLIAFGADLLRRGRYLSDYSESESAAGSGRLVLSRWTLFLCSVGFTLAGLAAETLFLNRFLDWTTGTTPLSTLKGCLFSVSWFLAVVYLASLRSRKQTVFPLALILSVLILIGAASSLGDSPRFARTPVYLAWGMVHGVSQLVFFTSLTIGLIVGFLYLVQAKRLKSRRGMGGIRLPSLEWLARANRRSLIWSVVALVPGIVSGIVLLRLRQIPTNWQDFVFDPTILGSSIIFLWLFWTLVRGRIYQPFNEGHATARRTIFLFVLLVLTMLAACFAPRGHLRSQTLILPTVPADVSSVDLAESPAPSESPDFAATGSNDNGSDIQEGSK